MAGDACADNKLDAIPWSIGKLQRLETLDAHNNCLTELPASLWNCASLTAINATSNFLGVWHDPPVGQGGGITACAAAAAAAIAEGGGGGAKGLEPVTGRRGSATFGCFYTSIPSEDLHRMTNLSVLYLNGNKLHTLPQELGKVKSLKVLDVGSNLLKYNVNNWEFDWNWCVSFRCSVKDRVLILSFIGTSTRT